MIAVLGDLNSWQTAAIVAKAATYGAALAAAGGVLFLIIFGATLTEIETKKVTRRTAWLAGIGIVATILRLNLTTGMLAGELAGMWDWSLLQIILGTSEGTASGVRVVGLLLVLLVMIRTKWATAGAALGALLVPLSFAGTGHALSMGSVSQVLVTLHLLAVAYWIGALWPLRILTAAQVLPRVASVMARFGRIAAYAVGVLVAVGAGLLWLIVHDISAFAASDYGRLVLVKLGLVAILLALAAMNKLRLVPRLEKEDQTALSDLRRSITAEILAVALILVVTATFTTVTGPPGPS